MPDLEKSFPDLDDYMDEYFEEIDKRPIKDGTAWEAHNRSNQSFYALQSCIHIGLFHHPDMNPDSDHPYTVLK